MLNPYFLAFMVSGISAPIDRLGSDPDQEYDPDQEHTMLIKNIFQGCHDADQEYIPGLSYPDEEYIFLINNIYNRHG